MFFNIFKPKWKKGSPEQRIKALEALDAKQASNLNILADVAVNAPDASVRSAALKRIKDHDLLESMVKQAKEESLKTAIQRQIINTVNAKELHRLGESELLEVVLQHKVSSVRLAAAEQIGNEGLFEIIARESKDKAVLRHARAQLKLSKHAQAKEQAKSDAIDAVCEQVEHLIGRAQVDQFYLAKYDKAMQAWDSLDSTPSTEQAQRFEKAKKACADDVAQLKAEKQTLENQAQAKATFERVLGELSVYFNQSKSQAPNAKTLEKALDCAQSDWKDGCEYISPTRAQQKQYDHDYQSLNQALKAFDLLDQKSAEVNAMIKEVDLFEAKTPDDVVAMRERIKPLQASLAWPEGLVKPVILNHWEQAVYKLNQLERATLETEQEAIRVLMRKRRQLDAHIEKGELKIANKIHGQIHDQLALLTPDERERQEQRLEPLNEKLQKLRDWHGYSTEPKKQDLCERMEQLIDTDMPALDKADAIKALQAEWREQTAVNIIEDDPLWARFKEAGNKAYEPCSNYYDELTEQKQANLQKRRELIVQLNDYVVGLDWEHADWKKVGATLHAARSEWKQYEPVKYPEAKPVHAQFFELVEAIKGKQKAHWQTVQEDKEALIEQANAQKEEEDLQKAIEKIIFLQKQWKDLGSTFRSKEQKLWKIFRLACDDVFARRDETRKAASAQTDEHIKEVEVLVERMQTLAQGSDDELNHSLDEVIQLQADFSEQLDANTVPEKVAKALKRKFDEARIHFDQQQGGVAQRKKIQAMKDLLQISQWLSQQESAVLDGGAFDESEWDKLHSTLEKAHQALFEERIAALQSGDLKTGLDANQAILEHLAIELEVLLDLDTPEHAKGERRAYQLDQLSQGHVGGQDEQARRDSVFHLLEQWMSVGAVKTKALQDLELRLQQVLKNCDLD